MAKRLFDLVVASIAAVFLSPVLLILSLAIWAQIGRPVFFRQRRPGFRGKPFYLIKFRTMSNTLDAKGNPLPDDQRLTAFGRMLRSLSLDELPQLWNVLRGDMSLVGPRPLLMEYLSRYSASQARRHEIRPGLTGWAQVNGRNALSWERKFDLDVWYVDHHTLWLDIIILFRTVWKVVSRDDISAAGHATMPEFTGISSERRET